MVCSELSPLERALRYSPPVPNWRSTVNNLLCLIRPIRPLLQIPHSSFGIYIYLEYQLIRPLTCRFQAGADLSWEGTHGHDESCSVIIQLDLWLYMSGYSEPSSTSDIIEPLHPPSFLLAALCRSNTI